MRCYEVVGLNDQYLTEDMLYEGFLDTIKQAVGKVITKKIAAVTNTATALAVIYKVATNPSYLDIATLLLKQSIKRKLKTLPNGPIKQAVIKQFPAGRTIKDFLKGIILISVVNARITAPSLAVGQGVDQVTDAAKAFATRLIGLDALIGTAASSATGIFAVLKALEVADTILFQVLTDIARKIAATLPQPATPPAQNVSLAK